MKFDHVGYDERTGKNSKFIETYNFHKAAAVLAEYGFDCIRLSDDWEGADFLAHHKSSNMTLMVQLKTCLVIDRRYLPFKELFMCFPLDGTGNWYMVKHTHLLEIVRKNAPQWVNSNRWKRTGSYFSYTATEKVRCALEEFAYKSHHGEMGFREAAKHSSIED